MFLSDSYVTVRMRVWLLKIKRQALNNSFLSLVCRYHNVNISVAVQTEHGLMVPVVKVLSILLNQYEESSMECLCHNALLILIFPDDDKSVLWLIFAGC